MQKNCYFNKMDVCTFRGNAASQQAASEITTKHTIPRPKLQQNSPT